MLAGEDRRVVHGRRSSRLHGPLDREDPDGDHQAAEYSNENVDGAKTRQSRWHRGR
jgi:hypothetical protein